MAWQYIASGNLSTGGKPFWINEAGETSLTDPAGGYRPKSPYFKEWYTPGSSRTAGFRGPAASIAETPFDKSKETIEIDPATGRMFVSTSGPFQITDSGSLADALLEGTLFVGGGALGLNAALGGLTGLAGAGAETGLAAELAAGAPELAGTMGLPAATAGGTLGSMTTPSSLAEEVASLGGTMTEAGGVLGPIAPGAAASLPAGVWEAVKAAGGQAVSAVKSLIDGGGTMSDLTKLLGAVAPAALGYIGAKDQQENLAALGEKYFNVGAPSRARFESSFAPGFTMESDPGYKDALDQTAKATMYSLSPGGNPVGSPNAWAKTLSDVNAKFAYPALQGYRQLNANTGGLASFTPAAINAEGRSVDAGKSMYDAIGVGAADIFNPRKSLAETMAEYQKLLRAA